MKKQWQWSSALPRKLVRRRRLYGFSFIWWSEAEQQLMTGRCTGTLHRVEMRHSPAANINIIAPILYIIYAHCIAITIRKLCTKQQMWNASGIQSLREKQTFKPSTNLSRNISPDCRKKKSILLVYKHKKTTWSWCLNEAATTIKMQAFNRFNCVMNSFTYTAYTCNIASMQYT